MARGKSDRSKAIDLADRWFSVHTRIKDATPDGNAACCTCSARKNWRDLDCGHFQVRSNLATRWLHNNAHSQCGRCNIRDGEQKLHAEYIDRRYGPGTADSIEKAARGVAKYSVPEILDIAKRYRVLSISIAKKNRLDIDYYLKKFPV